LRCETSGRSSRRVSTLPAASSIAILERGEHSNAEALLGFSPRRLSVRMN
jgi:hypothetical protein